MLVNTKPNKLLRVCQTVLIIGLLQLAGAAQAQWHWTDAQGRKVFSDLPPGPEIPDKNILKRPNSQATSEPAKPSVPPSTNPVGAVAPKVGGGSAATAANDTAKTQKEAEARVIEQNKAIKAKNCSAAQRYMVTLKSGIRIARANEKGEREFLDDAGIAAEMKQTQKIIESECG